MFFLYSFSYLFLMHDFYQFLDAFKKVESAVACSDIFTAIVRTGVWRKCSIALTCSYCRTFVGNSIWPFANGRVFV